MTSLSGQQYSTKTMSGLSNTYSNNIVCDTIDINNSLTLEPGGVLTLPPNSVQDSYLSNNVAFRNQANTFSLTNIFSNIVQFTSSTIPIITNSIPANDSTTKIPTTNWVDTYFGKKTLATGGTLQTWFGSNRFSSNSANLPITLQNTDVPTYFGGMFIVSGGGQYNANNQIGDTCLLSTGTSASNTGALSLTTWSSTSCGIRIGSSNIAYNGTNHNFNGNISLALYNFDVLNTGRTRGLRIANNGGNNGITDFTGVGVSTRFNFSSNDGAGVATTNFYISNGDSCYLQGASGLGIGMVGSAISLDGICSFTNTTTPVITQAISLADNSTKIATTAFVKGQNYITAASLTPYALLAGTQTFTGINTFSNNINLNATAFYNNSTDARFVSSTSEATQMYQVAGGFTITSISNGKFISLNTRDATGTIINNGLVCANGNQAYLQGTLNNRIDITNGQATIGGTSVPVITTQPLTASNNNEIASTAFVKNQGYITSSALTPYALLSPSSLQTFSGTGENTFNNQVNANAGVRFVDTFSSKISQQGNALVIENISNVNSVQIRSTTAGLVQRTGLLIENGITCTLQGGSGNTLTLTGLNTPTLSIPPLAGVYSSEIATTSWVNTELVGNYALLNPASLQTWGTNENQFNTQVTMNVVGTRYLNGANSSSITQTGNNLILANIANSNSIQLRTNTAGGVFSQNVLARNGNEIAIKGDTGIVRVLNTACTIECGTFSSEAPYNCGYLQLAGPITSKTNYNIGFINTIPGSSLNSGWATAIVAYNIFTIVWNGTGDYTLGVWLCDIVIVTNCTTSQNFSLCWNTISNTSMDITEKCAQSTVATQFNATGHQITRMSFVLNITNLLQTFWLNSFKVGGAGLSSNTAYSQIKFTRIA